MISGIIDYVVNDEKEIKPMSNYQYTLQDLYKIFQQAEDKVAQLREFQNLNLEYNINWENLIKLHS